MQKVILLLFLSVFVCCLQFQTTIAKRIQHPHYTKLFEQQQHDGNRFIESLAQETPQQVFTTLSGLENTYVVSWITLIDTATNLQWGESKGKYDTFADGKSELFNDPTLSGITRYIHLVMLKDLKPGTMIYYRVGDNTTNVWSDEYTFFAPHSSGSVNDKPLQIIVYGDMGLVNSVSMQNVIDEVRTGDIDMVMHIGDYAYDLFTDGGRYGDVWFNAVMPISTRVPYIGTVGNHETKYNASHYIHRFRAFDSMAEMSGSNTNWWYSWDFASGGARVHMVSISSEVYFTYVDNEPPPDLTPQRKAQYEWLDKDLAKARANSDWVIVYGHRPLYCSDVDSLGDCTSDAQTLREGINGEYGMEAMFMKHNIDLYISAHEHSYERIFPVYQGSVDPQSNHTYVNPKYPFYIVSGSAGCQEGLEWFDHVNYGAYSVVRSPTYGYGHLTIHNSTHLYWNQLLNEGYDGVDELWVVKDPQLKSTTDTRISTM